MRSYACGNEDKRFEYINSIRSRWLTEDYKPENSKKDEAILQSIIENDEEGEDEQEKSSDPINDDLVEELIIRKPRGRPRSTRNTKK